MRRIIIPLTILVFLCFTIACQQNKEVASKPKADVQADIKAIKDIVTGITKAFNSSDIDRYLSIYADNAVMFPPADPPSVGKEQIRSTIQQWFKDYAFQTRYEVLDVDVSGTMAIAHISFLTTVTPKSSGEPLEENGNWLWIFKKQSEGTWKAKYEMWSNETLIYPNEAE